MTTSAKRLIGMTPSPRHLNVTRHPLAVIIFLLCLFCMNIQAVMAVDCNGDGTEDLIDSVAGVYAGELYGTSSAPITTLYR